MADWSKPALTDTYANFLSYLAARDADLAAGLDPARVTVTNPPANAIRWNSANGYWEYWNGTAWGALAATFNIVAAQASKLKTPVAIAVSGDIAGSANFDGSAGISIAATLPNVNANAGTAGNSTTVPVITTNAKGQVTAVTQSAISFPTVPVTSVFGRTGAVALTSSDVTGALGYTPYNAASATAKLDKTGGTMTGGITMSSGALIYSSQAGSADNARNTGYKMSDGQDIGEMGRSNQYYDDLASNCNGYLPTGNCASNAYWTPPNANWWTWGLGFNYCANANAGQYDGAGGSTYGNYAVPSVALTYDGYYLAQDEIGGGEYHRWYRACNCNCNCGGYTNCNCGTTAFNCMTNCNCNCNCACNC